MIIGVDHVQFSVTDLVQSENFLIENGFKKKFNQDNFQVKEYQVYRSIPKSMVFFVKNNSCNIEIINGSSMYTGTRFLPIFKNSLECDDRLLDSLEKEIQEIRGLNCIGVIAYKEVTNLAGIHCDSWKYESSVRFWQSFGFKKQREFQSTTCLTSPQSLFESRPIISVRKVDKPTWCSDYVDDLGCSLIAVISNNINVDAERLKEGGFKVTEILKFEICGRLVSSCFVYGPCSEIVEIISFKKKAIHGQ